MLWDWDGTLERIHEALYVAARAADFDAALEEVAAAQKQLQSAEAPDLAARCGGTLSITAPKTPRRSRQ
jgi:hypothetical protein